MMGKHQSIVAMIGEMSSTITIIYSEYVFQTFYFETLVYF